MRLNIELTDVNDEMPLFGGLDENGRYSGNVAENLEPGAEFITVTATDKDELPDFKKVSTPPRRDGQAELSKDELPDFKKVSTPPRRDGQAELSKDELPEFKKVSIYRGVSLDQRSRLGT